MRVRLHGTRGECSEILDALRKVYGSQVLEVSRPYPDRGPGPLVRVYVEIRLDGHDLLSDLWDDTH